LLVLLTLESRAFTIGEPRARISFLIASDSLLIRAPIIFNMYETGAELYKGITDWMNYYNYQRGRKSLQYRTPEEMYHAA